MKIRDNPYTPEDVDCGFCALYHPEEGQTTGCCPFLRERLEAGVVGYQEAVQEAVKPSPRLRRRLNRLIAAYPGTFWVSPEHKRRMEWTKAVNRYRPNANEYYAAMYLLTANDALYPHSERLASKTHHPARKQFSAPKAAPQYTFHLTRLFLFESDLQSHLRKGRIE